MDNLLKSMLGKGGGSGGGIPTDIMASLQALSAGGKDSNDIKGLEKQAEGLWKMLDDMSENDPEGYAKFLKKQADAAKEEVAASKQGQQSSFQAMVEGEAPMVIIDLPLETTGPQSSNPGQKVALVQIWAAKKGKLSKSPSSQSIEALGKPFSLPLPFFQLRHPLVQPAPPTPPSSPLTPTASSPTIHCYFLSTTGEVLEQVFNSYDAAVMTKRRAVLAAAACQFVESKHLDVKLSVDRWRIRVSPSLLNERERKVLSEMHHQAKASRAAQGTSAQGLSSALLGQLTNLGADPTQNNVAPAAASSLSNSIQSKKAPLISELCPDEDPHAITSVAVEGTSVIVKMHLPNASKASEIDIEVDEGGRSLSISVEGFEDRKEVPLHHSFIVDPKGEVQAKFDKKTKTLTVTLALKN